MFALILKLMWHERTCVCGVVLALIFCMIRWILWVFTINPHETTLVLLGLPRGLTACCICSMQSCHLRKWCLLGLSFYFAYLPEDVQMLSVGMFDRIYFYIYIKWFYSHIYCVLHWFGYLFNRFYCFIVGNKEFITWKDLEQKELFWR